MTVPDRIDTLGLEDLPRRLSPGRHRVPSAEIFAIQRSRLVAATSSAAAIGGFRALSVDAIISTAGMSRRTFYMHFANTSEAFCAAYQRALDQMEAIVERAAAEATDPVAGALHGLGDVVERDPEIAQVCFVESLGAGPITAPLRCAAVARLTALLCDTREPSLESRLIVGGLHDLVFGYLTVAVPADLQTILATTEGALHVERARYHEQSRARDVRRAPEPTQPPRQAAG